MLHIAQVAPSLQNPHRTGASCCRVAWHPVAAAADHIPYAWPFSHFTPVSALQEQDQSEALRVGHTWALLLEAGCPPCAPPAELAEHLADLEMQRQAG